ncbi:hypothetical protein [Mucilaginibacter gracilis]|nr:hypothetical protein [Mucilaginibacter gracilis]
MPEIKSIKIDLIGKQESRPFKKSAFLFDKAIVSILSYRAS